jgi:hypothetical protein
MLDETADPWLLERHEREIFPLFHRRAWFAGSDDFLLYDVVADDGSVDEGVLAYSNGRGTERSLVLYQTRFASTRGRIRDSVAYARKTATGSRRLVRRSLADGLDLPRDPSSFVTFRDARTVLEHVVSCQEVWERGLPVSLDAYGVRVLWEFHEVHDGTSGQWARLARRLGGTGVPSLEEAIRESQLEPVHAPLRVLFDSAVVRNALNGQLATEDADHDELVRRLRAFYGAVAEATGLTGRAAFVDDLADTTADSAEMALEPELPADRADAVVMLAWSLIGPMGNVAPRDPAATTRAWFDELRLAAPLATGLRSAGLDEGEAWEAADLVRVLLHLPRPSQLHGPIRQRDAKLLEHWLADPTVRTAIGVNTWQGFEYLDRDRFVRMLAWAVRLDRASGGPRGSQAIADRLGAAAAAAGYRVDRLLASLAEPAKPPTPVKASKAAKRSKGPKG